MKDVQSQADHRCIAIHKVGVKDIVYPITVLDRANAVQATVASFNMYVNLPHHFKGTHMSRFVEILHRFRGRVELPAVRLMLDETRRRLQAESAHVEIAFPYFLRRPDGRGSEAIREYQCRMHGSAGERDDLSLTVEVPIAAPTPSGGGRGLPRSLGRWGQALVSLRFRHFIWLEEVIDLVEAVTSHGLTWPAASGDREEGLTVEGLARALASRLALHPDIGSGTVEVENLAAGYSTFAVVHWPQAEYGQRDHS
ncbi:MAG: GTP cyclohydrolase, FolE2/MptA family [Thermodesulfobacteriota bacterium]